MTIYTIYKKLLRIRKRRVNRRMQVYKTKKEKIQNHSKYLANKEAARKLVTDKLEIYVEKYRSLGILLSYNKLSVRNQTSRWGSCSSKKNLNFNYKIIFLPDHLVEYIVAHELCHLIEMNHGKNFWKLVSCTVPQYIEHKNALSKIRLSDIGQINL